MLAASNYGNVEAEVCCTLNSSRYACASNIGLKFTSLETVMEVLIMTYLSKRKFIICTITFSICLSLLVMQNFCDNSSYGISLVIEQDGIELEHQSPVPNYFFLIVRLPHFKNDEFLPAF